MPSARSVGMQGKHVHCARAAQREREAAAQHDPGQGAQRCAGEVADHPEQKVQPHRDPDGTAQRGGVDHERRAHHQHRQQRADRGAGRDAQYVRVGQRVAQQGLHHDAGQCQRAACDESRQRTSGAQFEQRSGQRVGLATQHFPYRLRQLRQCDRDGSRDAGKQQAGDGGKQERADDRGSTPARGLVGRMHMA